MNIQVNGASGIEDEQSKCSSCLKRQVSDFQGICDACEEKFGPHLGKALCDPFDYAIGLKNGHVFRLVGGDVSIVGEWLIINGIEEHTVPLKSSTFPRGMQLRLSEVAWIADAPEGS